MLLRCIQWHGKIAFNTLAMLAGLNCPSFYLMQLGNNTIKQSIRERVLVDTFVFICVFLPHHSPYFREKNIQAHSCFCIEYEAELLKTNFPDYLFYVSWH